MTRRFNGIVRGVMIAAVFSLGYLAGTVQSPAQAQLGDMGKDMGGDLLKQATDSGGMLGQAAQLGTTITEMEEHLSGLQTNVDALNKLKAALGG